MQANNKIKKSTFLRLVVKDSDRVNYAENEHIELDDSAQFEMFGQPNSIYFVTARDLDLDNIKNLIDLHHFHHIIDLREVPYLNFGTSSRDIFFNLIAKYSVDYLSLFSLASSHKQTSVYDLLNKAISNSHDISHELSKWLENGPTLALITKERKVDTVAKSFSKFLVASKITLSEIAK